MKRLDYTSRFVRVIPTLSPNQPSHNSIGHGGRYNMVVTASTSQHTLFQLLLWRPVFSWLEAQEQTCAQHCSGSVNCFLSLQYGLQDLQVEFLPNAFLKIRNVRWATGLPVLVPSDLARHSCFHRDFQLFPRAFDGFPELFVLWINVVNTSQLSRVIELRFLDHQFLNFFSLRCI